MRILLAAAVIAAFAATPAQACRSPASVIAIVHNALPPELPEGLVAVEAAFSPDLTSGDFRRSGGEARILRVVRGHVPFASIRVVSDEGQSSCHYAFSNGHRGLLVGRLKTEKGHTLLEPVWVVRRNDFQMR